ncbi:ethanolamine ammonia-lyase subunit EutC [Methylococcus sp. Mc7]|uniref:ethanolamine ammonia-lyase subunit EutC n=1 Tax=Methylococcus sp. Mc7 TaxID=2860258 RepID=UPI001C52D0BC|nr:ethanolamine ammonia-lyase subunit EutC [Methylococcus sp. Mc7]QXP82729.1 ethanolamine ammonia-lyase subunit EutC [Methylococcus sp. Mc7]
MNDRWSELRTLTQARIALGHAGHALPTAALLDFQLAHASARDAVHKPWDVEAFAEGVRALGLRPLLLATPVADRAEYLKRPDLGQMLDRESERKLRCPPPEAMDIALVVTNGLSSTALDRHGLPLVQAIASACCENDLRLGPVCLVANGRVAVSDPVGAGLHAQVAVIVIGERPGLSADDSLGLYFTYAPRPGRSNAERNCIFNVRPPAGLGYHEAASKLVYLTRESFRLGLSGVALKDETQFRAITAGR